MTTAEAIDTITDAGKFELLALPVLRALHADCLTLAHLGVNEVGKTIANPIDGFSLVPWSAPPHYVAAAFTTVASKDLRSKWLLDASLPPPRKKARSTRRKPGPRRKKAAQRVDGDLIKAADEASALRKRQPNAKFTVYLTTNRRLTSDLMTDVYQRGSDLGIDVCFLEQSQLRDFLDTTPQGQWLRKEHLGVAADQISEPFLAELALKSLSAYADEKLLFTGIDNLVRTTAARNAYETLGRSHASLHLLVGRSGAGKTVIACDAFRRHVESGGLGLWISDETAHRAGSLSEAVEGALITLSPSLAKGCGNAALQLGTGDRPLVLVIDDISRASKPAALLNKIMGWCRSLQPTAPEVSRRPPVVAMCPLWESYFSPLRERLEGAAWLQVQAVEPLRDNEAIACLEASARGAAATISRTSLRELAAPMNGDPILLALLGEQLWRRGPGAVQIVSEDVVGNFAESMTREVSLQTGIPDAEFSAALVTLAREMILRRCLNPKWSDITDWLCARPRALEAIEHLAKQQHVCRTPGPWHSRRFEFRHDRVRDFFLAHAAANILDGPDAERELIADPYFVPIIGRALAYAQDRAAVEWVAKRAPVALIASLDYVRRAQAPSIVEKARGWLANWPDIPEALRDDAFEVLGTVRSRRVLDVTSGVPGVRAVWHARLRGGDAAAGAMALSSDFFPRAHFTWLETLIEEAMFAYGSELKAGLRSILTRPELSDGERNGALCLAGYIGEEELADLIRTAWENAETKIEIFPAALWAACRCAGDAPETLVGDILAGVFDLSDESSTGSGGDRWWALDSVAWAMRLGVGEPLLRYLIALPQSNAEYAPIVWMLLERVDHPIAVKFVAQKLAIAQHAARQADLFYPFAQSWADQWDPTHSWSSPISAAALEELRSLWSNENGSQPVREYAFSVWARLVPDPVVSRELLAAVPPGDGTIWHRARRGDRQVIPEIAARLRLNSHWLHVVPQIWCEALKAEVERWLIQVPKEELSSNLCCALADCLRDIPREEGVKLLLGHWSTLRLQPRFIQAALYLSSDETRSRADEALRQRGPDSGTLKHIAMFFGFRVIGLADKITMAHLESIRPYVDQVDNMCIEEMIEFCASHERMDWAETHLRPECARRAEADSGVDQQRDLAVRRRWFPTDQDVLDKFDGLEREERQRRRFSIFSWFEHRHGPILDSGRCFVLLSRWVSLSPTISRYAVAAEIVQQQGTRAELRILRTDGANDLGSDYFAILESAEYRVKRRSLE